MRFIGLKTAMLAAGLMLVGTGHAAPQAAAPAPTSAAPTAIATPTAPAPVAASPAAASSAASAKPAADPEMLVRDGAPEMAPTKGIGDAVDGDIGVQPQVTKNGERAAAFHNGPLLITIIGISVFVLILLLIVIVRFNARANPVASKTAHNTAIEIAWTLIPVFILVLLAIPSIGLLQAQFKPAPKNAITLKATGNQWYWTYSYPDNGGFEITSNMLKEKSDPDFGANDRARTDADGPRLLAVDNRVVLPVGVPIRLITTSADVIHSWAIPAFWIKLDAVPGRINETSFTIEKPGLYFGQCSELCGPKHGYMPIAVQAVPLDIYNRWVVAKGGTVAGAAPAADAAATGNAAAPAGNTAAPTSNASAPADNAAAPDNAAAGNSTGQ